MTLPRELRDEIYGYLLRVDRLAVMEYNETNPAKLDLSILCVNRLLHNEASRTLFWENPWVCIEVEGSILQDLRSEEIMNKKGFPASSPVTRASYAHATTVAVATMTLQKYPQLGLGIDRTPLLISLFAIPRLCRILTAYREIHNIYVAVYLNAANAGKAREAWQEKILDWFQEARGIGSANIFDAQGNRSHVKLTTLMMSPITSFQEILDRASIYQDSGLQKKKLCQISEACYDYQDGHDFILWFNSSTRLWVSLLNSSNDRTKGNSIFRVLYVISVSCAFLCIALGELDRALSVVHWITGERRGNPKYVVGTEVWFHRGLRDLAIGAWNGAAYCFLQTLWRDPGHPRADKAIDEMELRLQSGTGLTERIILHNIQHVLQVFRHQTRGSGVKSKVGYGVLFEQWHVGRKEHKSIGYRHSICSSESVGLDN